jgi:NADH:ubiquinone oxidoreductase subunit E
LKLLVCVGSACHLRGANKVLNECNDAIAEFNLENKVELLAGFCQGHCTEGVNVFCDDERISGVLPGTVREVFLTKIIPRIKEGDR